MAYLSMPRKRPPISPESFYHITARTRNREPFPIPIGEVWNIFEDTLHFISHAFKIEIVNFALMDNHFHLIARSKTMQLPEALQHLLRYSTLFIHEKTGDINQIWGNRYYRCELNCFHYALNAYKYVYQNPMRPGLVKRCEDYPYSTLAGKLGLRPLYIPTTGDVFLFEGSLEDNLNWLNQKIDPENLEAFRKGLKRRVFQLPARSYDPHPLTVDLI